MKNLFLGCLVVTVMGLAFWAYTENYATKGSLDKIAQLNDCLLYTSPSPRDS